MLCDKEGSMIILDMGFTAIQRIDTGVSRILKKCCTTRPYWRCCTLKLIKWLERTCINALHEKFSPMYSAIWQRLMVDSIPLKTLMLMAKKVNFISGLLKSFKHSSLPKTTRSLRRCSILTNRATSQPTPRATLMLISSIWPNRYGIIQISLPLSPCWRSVGCTRAQLFMLHETSESIPIKMIKFWPIGMDWWLLH